ncbi:uncharacterized protein ACNLHF_009211 [Anomaloglossus baeobatrachus]
MCCDNFFAMPLSTEALVCLCWIISCRFGVRRHMLQYDNFRRNRLWVHPLIMMRPMHGNFHTLFLELRHYPDKFFSYCRLTVESFDYLLNILRPHLQHQDTWMRLSISPEERFMATLRFLATGQSFSALHFDFLLGRSTIAVIVRHTCDMIWQHLKEEMMPQPNRQDWLKISKGFKDCVDFPNCIGALDGKHFRVKKPPNSGSRYFNFHKFFSVVILALVDTDYRFIYAGIGAYGSASDARIFRSSRLAQWLQENSLLIPPPVALPGTSGPLAPYVMVADAGFALSKHVMRPYPRRSIDDRKQYFNYRLTKARRYVECSFGILSNKWRIYQTTIQLQPNSVKSVIKATIVFHNFCRIHEGGPYVDDEFQINHDVNPTGEPMSHNSVTSGLQIRNLFTDYFNCFDANNNNVC